MPTYDYRCKDCGTTHEIQHGFNDERPTTCPTCGGHLARVFHPVGVVFKGSGFHKTDYSGAGTKASASESAKTDGAASTTEPSAAGGSKSDSSSAASSKPAQKTDPKPSGSS